MLDILVFTIAVVTGSSIVLLTLGRPSNAVRQADETKILKPVYIEELPSERISDEQSARAISEKGLSDKEFKELFLNSDESIGDIAAAAGYKSNSSVYRRAKKLGLSVKDR